VPFLLQVAAAGGVQRDPGPGGVAEVLGVLGEQVGIDVAVPGFAGGACRFPEVEEGVDGLPGPGLVGPPVVTIRPLALVSRQGER